MKVDGDFYTILIKSKIKRLGKYLYNNNICHNLLNHMLIQTLFIFWNTRMLIKMTQLNIKL